MCNASAVLDRGNAITRRFVRRLLEAQGIDAVASDAHDCRYRPQRLAQAYEALLDRCSPEYAHALVHFKGVQP